MTKLTTQNVHDIFKFCLFDEGEPTEPRTIGEGVVVRAGFHPGRLKESETAISEMLECLPDNYKAKIGGGWSFLNLCVDKDGTQWTDLHSTMDELVALGHATGKLTFLMERENWKMFPGGMPYVTIN